MDQVAQTIYEIKVLERKLLEMKKRRETSLAARTKIQQKKFKLESLQIKLIQKVKLNHQRLQELETESRMLLVGKGSPIVVTKTTSNFLSFYTNKLQGRMHKNGFFYGNANNPVNQGRKLISYLLLPISQRRFPVSYKGHINIFGGFILQVDKSKSLNDDTNCPHHITADIAEDGKIAAVVEEYYEHVAESVLNVIFDPFNADGDRAKRFGQHKQEMLEIVRDIVQHS